MPYGVLKLRLQMLFFSVHAFIFISWKKIKQRKGKTRVESSKKKLLDACEGPRSQHMRHELTKKYGPDVQLEVRSELHHPNKKPHP